MSGAQPQTKEPASQRVVIVTGANRGIGLEYVRQLLEEKSHPAIEAFPGDTIVVATARNPEAATKLQELKAKHGDRLDIQPLEVTDEAQIQALVQHVTDKYNRLDLLLNNAGYLEPAGSTPSTLAMDEMKKVFEVNTFAPIAITRAFLPLLQATKKVNDNVRVAFISTIMSSIDNVTRPYAPAYRASKTALNMYARCFAFENPEISFAIIHPGWVQTDMGCRAGGRPPIDPPTSVNGGLKIIQKMSPSDPVSHLYDAITGGTIPW